MRVFVQRRLADGDRMRACRRMVVPVDMDEPVAMPVQMHMAQQRRRLVMVVMMIVAVRMPVMMVVMPALTPDLAPGRDGDPQAEADEGEARHGIDEPAEALGERRAGDPDDAGDDQRRDDMPGAGDKRVAGRLAPRPAALAGDQRDRDPMVRNDRVQDADRGDGADQQQLRGLVHAVPSSFQRRLKDTGRRGIAECASLFRPTG